MNEQPSYYSIITANVRKGGYQWASQNGTVLKREKLKTN